MKVGVVYPQIELKGDPEALHKIGVATEELGYNHLLMYDHVVGAVHEDRDPPLWGPYTEKDPFHDPFVAFAYLAAVTKKIEFSSAVLILPQRQTVLVAQQAADVDLLSGGRLRLGVGTGWNYVEYDALGQDFKTRGKRLDEQITLLRQLWTEDVVTFEGGFHRVDRACINPRPKRSIPIWIGGFSEPAFRRGGRVGDGFIFAGSLRSEFASGSTKVDSVLEGWQRVQHHLAEAGRSVENFGADFIALASRSVTDAVDEIHRWRDAGGTHASVYTMDKGFTEPEQHIDFLAEVRAKLDID